MPSWKKLLTSGSNVSVSTLSAKGIKLISNGHTAISSSGAELALGDLTGNNGYTSIALKAAQTSSIVIDSGDIKFAGIHNQSSEATSLMINGSGVIGTRELGSNAFTSTTVGTTTNALTVDNSTLALNSGTTFNGSAARTISIKADGVGSAQIADNAINSEHYTDGSIDTAHIGDDQVTYAKIQNVSATNVVLGRDSSGAGVIEEIGASALRTILNVADGATANAGTLTGNGTSGRMAFYSGTTTLSTDADLTYNNGTNTLTLGTADLNFVSASSAVTSSAVKIDNPASLGSEATSIMIDGSGNLGTRELGSNAFNSTTIGTTSNALTVDNTTLQLNSGTTFNGSGARTVSAKTAAISDGGTGLATADQIHTFVTDFGYTTNTGTVDTSGTPVDNDFAKFTDANTIEGRSASETKTDLSLNNVENTAISTFAGSTNITTLGTIGTGVWNGTAIAHAYIGADAIEADNIADNAINSEHYTDGSIDTAHIADDQVTYAKIQNVSATNKILGRDSSGAGIIEEISPADVRTMINVEDGSTADQTKADINGLAITTVGTIDTGVWNGTAIAHDYIGADAIDGTNIADDAVDSEHIAADSIDAEHYAAGSVDTTALADDNVTYAKIQNVSATNRILGRDTAGAGVIEEITPANVRTMINVEDGATADQTAAEIRTAVGTGNNGVIPSTGTAGHFLKHDGTFGIPAYTTNTDTNTNQLTTFSVRDDDDEDVTIAHGKFLKFVAATGTLGTNTTGTGTTSDPFVVTITSPDTDTNTNDDVSVANLKTRLAGGFGSNAVTIGDSNDVVTIGGTIEVTSHARAHCLGVGTAASTTEGEIRATNDITAYYSSDIRLKENIKPLEGTLEKIDSIRGVTYDWKELTEEERKTVHSHTGSDIGVIAQEVEEVFPDLVENRPHGYKAVNYEKLSAVLLSAVKELKQEVEDLKKKIG